MVSKERLQKIDELLKRDYPIVQTPLTHNNLYELIVSVMLSAQTLDATVNKKTPALFSKYKTIDDLANADVADVEQKVAGVNYFKTKAKHLVEMAQKVRDDFGGEIPGTMDELLTLPGVGRKTANVVIGEWFARPEQFRNRVIQRQHEGVTDGRLAGFLTEADLKMPNFIEGYEPPGFVVDTHVLRVAKRLGLTENTTPEKVEKDMMKLFPKEEWADVALRIVFHGRYRCTAKNPQCYFDSEWSKICSCAKEKSKRLKV